MTATPIALAFQGVTVQYISIYIAALVAANMGVAWLGPSAMPVIAFFLIGLDLTLRDRLHDRWRGKRLWPRMLGLIVTAGVISDWLNPASGPIALASVVAFGLASLADAGVYHMLGGRSWSVRANGSNVAGASVDSLVFPIMAFGTLLPSIALAQLVAKVAGGFIWATGIAWLNRATNRKAQPPIA